MSNLASGFVKLAAVRMGDLIISPSTEKGAGSSGATATQAGYVPPNKRKEAPVIQLKPEALSDSMLFPSIGENRPISKDPLINFKKAVDDCIEKEKHDQAERERLEKLEDKHHFMTKEQLESNGWAVLRTDRTAVQEAAENLYQLGLKFKAFQEHEGWCE